MEGDRYFIPTIRRCDLLKYGVAVSERMYLDLLIAPKVLSAWGRACTMHSSIRTAKGSGRMERALQR